MTTSIAIAIAMSIVCILAWTALLIRSLIDPAGRHPLEVSAGAFGVIIALGSLGSAMLGAAHEGVVFPFMISEDAAVLVAAMGRGALLMAAVMALVALPRRRGE